MIKRLAKNIILILISSSMFWLHYCSGELSRQLVSEQVSSQGYLISGQVQVHPFTSINKNTNFLEVSDELNYLPLIDYSNSGF